MQARQYTTGHLPRRGPTLPRELLCLPNGDRESEVCDGERCDRAPLRPSRLKTRQHSSLTPRAHGSLRQLRQIARELENIGPPILDVARLRRRAPGARPNLHPRRAREDATWGQRPIVHPNDAEHRLHNLLPSLMQEAEVQLVEPKSPVRIDNTQPSFYRLPARRFQIISTFHIAKREKSADPLLRYRGAST